MNLGDKRHNSGITIDPRKNRETVKINSFLENTFGIHTGGHASTAARCSTASPRDQGFLPPVSKQATSLETGP